MSMGNRFGFRPSPGLILVLGVSFIAAWGCGRAPKPRTADIRSVEVVPVRRADIMVSTEYAARIKPDTEVKVTAKISGRAAAVRARVGDVVKKGQVLVTIESQDYQDQYRQAEAALSSATANLTRTGQSSLSLQVLQAQAAVQQAQVALDDTKSLFDKTTKLFESGVVTRQQMDDVETKYKSAQIQKQTAADNLSLITHEAGPQSNDVAAAQVDQAKAALSLAQSRLSDTVIRSPIDGVVSYRGVESGELVSAGVPVFVVIDVSMVIAQADVSEMNVHKVTVGMKVSVIVSSQGGTPLEGTVDSISPSSDARTQLYAVKVRIDNPLGSLMPGMLARLRLPLESKSGVLTVPNGAVFMENGSEYVYLAADGLAQKTRVEIGTSDQTISEILSGLSEGDLVVIAGQDLIDDGDPLNVVK